jgi:hypothetical protein
VTWQSGLKVEFIKYDAGDVGTEGKGETCTSDVCVGLRQVGDGLVGEEGEGREETKRKRLETGATERESM